MAMYHNIEIDNLAKSLLSFEDGKDNPTTEEITAKIAAIKLDMLRDERNLRLSESDWLVVKANETGSTVSNDWKTYRQALRDITKTATCLEDATFPTQPT